MLGPSSRRTRGLKGGGNGERFGHGLFVVVASRVHRVLLVLFLVMKRIYFFSVAGRSENVLFKKSWSTRIERRTGVLHLHGWLGSLRTWGTTWWNYLYHRCVAFVWIRSLGRSRRFVHSRLRPIFVGPNISKRWIHKKCGCAKSAKRIIHTYQVVLVD